MNAARVVAGLMIIAATTPLHAQQWHVEGQAGRIRSALDPANTASESFAVGLRYDQVNSGFRISAGIPTSGDQALWGAVAGAHRFAFRSGSFLAGVDASANLFALHDRVDRTREVEDVFQRRTVVPAPSLSGFAGAVQGMPVIGFETMRLQGHLRAGVSHYTSEFGEQQRDRTVSLADAQLSWLPNASIAIMPALRYYSAAEDDYKFAGVTAVAGTATGNVWASTGRWLDIEQQDATWAAGATLRLHKRATLTASGRHDSIDPLYMTPAQTAWSVGFSVQVGGVTPATAPVASVHEAGTATIRLPLAKAPTAPRVAGDFTKWQPQPMQRSGDAWVYSVKLAPGVYNYAFVDAKGDWFVPEEFPGRKKDGMGGVVAVLVVR